MYFNYIQCIIDLHGIFVLFQIYVIMQAGINKLNLLKVTLLSLNTFTYFILDTREYDEYIISVYLLFFISLLLVMLRTRNVKSDIDEILKFHNNFRNSNIDVLIYDIIKNGSEK